MNLNNKGKISSAVIYGDSISTYEFGGGGYGNLLREKLSIENIYNHAVSGSTLSRGIENSLVSILQNEENIHSGADLIIIWHGTNDWYWGIPAYKSEEGEVNFEDETEYVISLLRGKCPNAEIAFLTPLYRFQAPFGTEFPGDAYSLKNKVGSTLKDYYDVIIEKSRKLCFPVIDIRRLSNINYYNAGKYLPDFVHPSQEGYIKITEIISKEIDRLSFV